MLSCTIACEKLHQYVYGRDFRLVNDHKPLQYLFKKPLASCPPRVQRLMLRLQKYSFEYQWAPGKSLNIADTLSRAPQPSKPEDTELDRELNYQVHMICATLPFSAKKLASFRHEVKSDAELQQLKTTIVAGWPRHKNDAPFCVRQYWQFRDELSVCDNLLLRGERVIIPQKFRKEMLERIHEGYLGRDKCLSRAKAAMFWVGMATEIKNCVEKCAICLKFQSRQQKEPLISHARPNFPWNKLGTDVFTFLSKNYLLVVDYHSNYFETVKLDDMTAENLIDKLKAMFARLGIPETLVSDNGSNYACEKFRDFTENWGINHVTVSPRYPKANGLAEKYCGIAKKLMKKAKETKIEPHIAFMNYRDTPVIDGKSPAELLMGRKLRTRLPVNEKCLKTALQTKTVQNAREKNAMTQARHYNNTATRQPLGDLKPGDKVVFRHNGEWIKGTIVNSCGPRSYQIQSKDKSFRRNRAMIKPDKTVVVRNPPRNEDLLTRALLDAHPTQPDTPQLSTNVGTEINNASSAVHLDPLASPESASETSIQRTPAERTPISPGKQTPLKAATKTPVVQVQHGSNTSAEQVTTRSGRVVKATRHFDDFVHAVTSVQDSIVSKI
ncbi:uncharacterized protein K02A2.6-like [Lineus longissimus]|uniref:uncharacterized protein K02A2.6-like n=1 Tax=Lineus longissimus TaxID=88925 RepID=UPI00315D652E